MMMKKTGLLAVLTAGVLYLQDAVGKQRQLMRRLLQNRLQQRLNTTIH